MLKLFRKHPHFKDVENVLKTLGAAGFTAWLAGGCVRDGLLGVTPKDFDVATDALPDQIQELFPKSLDVGKSFGVIILPFEGFQVEVATFRNDGDYQDGRRPDSVTYSSPDEDARRRDFTINALFYDVAEKKVHDFVEGVADLKRRQLRCVGDPAQRFQEDQLRLLRGVRFTAQLGFQLEASTWEAIRDFRNPLKNVSRERVIEEMEKLLCTSGAGEGLLLLKKTSLFQDIFEPVADSAQSGVAREWQWVSDFVKDNAPVEFSWALLLYRASLSEETKVKSWVSSQPFSRKKRSDILNALKLTKLFYQAESPALEELVILLDRSLLNAWFFDFLLKMGSLHSVNKEPQVHEFQKLYSDNLNSQGFLLSPLVNGADLISMGIKKGPRMGALLEKIYQIQIRENITSKSDLLSHPEIRACTSIVV